MRRFARVLAHRPRPAAILASGVAVIVLGALGSLGASDVTLNDLAPRPAAGPAPTVTITQQPQQSAKERALVETFNAGWKAGVRDLGNGTHATYPNVAGDANNPGTVAWVDGWIDGQADALGDDDRDGRVEPGEQGWHRDASHTSR